MSLLQKIISLVLYAGHAAKKVHSEYIIYNQPYLNIHDYASRLSSDFRNHLTVSYTSLLRLVDKVGENYDAEVHNWQDVIVRRLESSSQIEVIMKFQKVSFLHAEVECNPTLFGYEDDAADQLSVSSCDSDTSHPQYSPVTSDSESISESSQSLRVK